MFFWEGGEKPWIVNECKNVLFRLRFLDYDQGDASILKLKTTP